jgi:hypothetical protein
MDRSYVAHVLANVLRQCPPSAEDSVVRERTLAPPPVPTKPDHLLVFLLARYVAMDAAKIWIKPESHYAWGKKGAASKVTEDARMDTNARNGMAINYYIAVSYEYGGLVLRIVSGTKGKDHAQAVYQVRIADMRTGWSAHVRLP